MLKIHKGKNKIRKIDNLYIKASGNKFNKANINIERKNDYK